jgi:hypothetical protein
MSEKNAVVVADPEVIFPQSQRIVNARENIHVPFSMINENKENQAIVLDNVYKLEVDLEIKKLHKHRHKLVFRSKHITNGSQLFVGVSMPLTKNGILKMQTTAKVINGWIKIELDTAFINRARNEYLATFRKNLEYMSSKLEDMKKKPAVSEVSLVTITSAVFGHKTTGEHLAHKLAFLCALNAHAISTLSELSLLDLVHVSVYSLPTGNFPVTPEASNCFLPCSQPWSTDMVDRAPDITAVEELVRHIPKGLAYKEKSVPDKPVDKEELAKLVEYYKSHVFDVNKQDPLEARGNSLPVWMVARVCVPFYTQLMYKVCLQSYQHESEQWWDNQVIDASVSRLERCVVVNTRGFDGTRESFKLVEHDIHLQIWGNPLEEHADVNDADENHRY